MNTPQTTRRDVLRSAAGLPLAAVALARTRLRVPDRAPAPLPKAPAQPVDLTQLVNLVIDAVARRPLRLYLVMPERCRLAVDADMRTDHRDRLARFPWSQRALAHNGFVAEMRFHALHDALLRGELRGTEDHPGPVEMAVTDLVCHGRAYWVLCAQRWARPHAAWGMPCHKVIEVSGPNGRVTEYHYSPRRAGGKTTPVPAQNVIRFCSAFIYLGMPTDVQAAAQAQAGYLRTLIAGTLTEWTNRHPLAVELGWDRLVWAFDDAPAPQSRPRT